MTFGDTAIEDTAAFDVNVLLSITGIGVASIAIVGMNYIPIASVYMHVNLFFTRAGFTSVRVVCFTAGRCNDISTGNVTSRI